MTTYAELKTRILYSLDDSSAKKYGNTLLYHSICGAIDAILPWVSKPAVTTITGDGLAKQFALPASLYKIEGVKDLQTGLFLESVSIAPLPRQRSVSADAYQWMSWPAGYLTLTQELTANDKIDVYYSAYWSKPANESDDTFVFDFPQMAMAGAMYWAAAYCLTPSSISSALVRQYNIKVDSGVPTDNPIENSTKFLRALFMDEMNRIPKRAGGAP